MNLNNADIRSTRYHAAYRSIACEIRNRAFLYLKPHITIKCTGSVEACLKIIIERALRNIIDITIGEFRPR